jgi:hypothetical protein
MDCLACAVLVNGMKIVQANRIFFKGFLGHVLVGPYYIGCFLP